MIICIDGRPRNVKLAASIRAIEKNIDIRIVEAVKPDDIDPEILKKIRSSSEYLLGRRISDPEIATMLSHRKCYEILRQDSWPTAYILEDDIDLSESSFDFQRPLMQIGLDTLRILTLVKSPWSIWKRKQGILKALIPPPCAAAYVINQKTANFALSFDPIGIADWPPWSHEVEFLYDKEFDLPIYVEGSLIEDSRSKFINENNLRVLFQKSPRTLFVKKIWQIRYTLWYKFLWRTRKFNIFASE